MKETFSKKQKYYALGAFLLSLMTLVYFVGPKSELTLISRLHYNSLFVLTPCIGREQFYNDEAVNFNYPASSLLLNRKAPVFVNPFSSPGNDLDGYVDMNIPLKPSYKYKALVKKTGATGTAVEHLAGFLHDSGMASTKAEFKRGSSLVKTEGIFGGPGNFEFFYALGKNDYVYRIAMPYYPYRSNNGIWLLDALYNAGLLPRDYFTDFPKPRGFWNWFLTPCADKQAYCAGKMIKRTLEIKD